MRKSVPTTSSINNFDPDANPTLARVRSSWEASGKPPYQDGTHYRIVTLESGAERSDLPIFTSLPGAIQLQDNPIGVTRSEIEDTPGGFVLQNVLTPSECDEMVRFSETCGYTEDAPVSLARHIRQNENCVWLADDQLVNGIFERCKDLFPQEVAGGAVCGLNARWRLYKYNPADIFKTHTDGSWPGSGLDSSGRLVRDRYGDRWSQLTIVIYLNDEFEGGPTRFFFPSPSRRRDEYTVTEARAPRGGAVCFFHGEHPQSPLHEGGLVTKGTKYIIRSDVLYKLSSRSGQEGWRQHYAQLPNKPTRAMLEQLMAAAPPEQQRQIAALLASGAVGDEDDE